MFAVKRMVRREYAEIRKEAKAQCGSSFLKRVSLLACFALAVVIATTPAHAQAEKAIVPKATSASDLQVLENKFRALGAKPGSKADTSADPLVQEASQAVSRIPLGPGKKLDRALAKELVELLRVSEAHDPYNQIADDNSDLILANRKLIRELVSALPPEEAKEIMTTLDIVENAEAGISDPEMVSSEAERIKKLKEAVKSGASTNPSKSDKKSK